MKTWLENTVFSAHTICYLYWVPSTLKYTHFQETKNAIILTIISYICVSKDNRRLPILSSDKKKKKNIGRRFQIRQDLWNLNPHTEEVAYLSLYIAQHTKKNTNTYNTACYARNIIRKKH